MKDWKLVSFGELLTKSDEWIRLDPMTTITQVRVQWWGQGAVPRKTATAGELGSDKWLAVRWKQFLISRIDARKGAAGVVPRTLDGAFVSNDFPAFNIDTDRLEPQFLDWYSKTARFVQDCKGASEGTTNRVRLKEERFLALSMPLPPLEEQRRIVEQVETLMDRLRSVNVLQLEMDQKIKRLLLSAYQKAIEGAAWHGMSAVAPLVRRPVEIDPLEGYPELGIRSFGKGSFHKPSLQGSSVGSKKLFRIAEGDLVFNIVFAWEGAVAVAKRGDNGRFGSHRFLTCVTDLNVALPEFLCFHFLTDGGLEQLGKASPGGAGRNRTLGIDNLARIVVPVPDIETQRRFVRLLRRFDERQELREIPSVGRSRCIEDFRSESGFR